MKINNDDLRHIYQAYIRDRIPASRDACPSAEHIQASFMPSASRRKKAKIIRHISGCADCAQEFQFFLRLFREEQGLINGIDRLSPGADRNAVAGKKLHNSLISSWPRVFSLHLSWKSVLVRLSASILIAVAILATNKIFISRKTDERGKLSNQVHLLEPVHKKVALAPLVFKWKGIRNAHSFMLEIFDGTLLPLWKSPRIIETSYQLPSEISQKLQPNKTYFWMITAFRADGAAVESSLEDFLVVK
jgi:hypothetical protein